MSDQSDLEIELLGTKDTGPCECCGCDSRTAWGLVTGAEQASYFVQWTLGEAHAKGAFFDLIMGSWGDGTSASDRFAVSLELRWLPNGPAFMVIDACSRRVAKSELVGRALRREEVIGTDIAPRAFKIVDAIWLGDPRIFEVRGEPASADRFTGCMLGLALGDALGAPHEGGLIEQLAWKAIGRTRAGEMRWTDDTQMSLDLADSIIAEGGVDLDHIAGSFADGYRMSRGYGPGAAKLLKLIKSGAKWSDANKSVFPDGSFGNGGAMRAPVIGLYCSPDLAACARVARDVASITHAHPLGMEGAALISTATAAALSNAKPLDIFDLAAKHCIEAAFVKKLDIARSWLASGSECTPKEVARHLGNGIAAADSCVTALYLAMRFLRRPFEDLMDFVVRCGGDVDTIGAMSGAIFGSGNGASALPEGHLQRLEACERIHATGEVLYRLAHSARAHQSR